MHHRKSSQNGFSHILLVVLVVVLAAIGLIGWTLMQGNKETGSTAKTADQVAADGSDPNKDNKTPASSSRPTSEQAYLTIKEWGVRVPLSQNDRGAYYVVSDYDQPMNSSLKVFAAETDALVGPKGKSCKGEYVSILLRLAADDSRWQDADTSVYFTNTVVIGGYKYGVSSKKQYGPECFDGGTSSYEPDSATATKFDSIVQQFEKDFKAIEAY